MIHEPLDLGIKQLVQCLRRVNEPISIDRLLHITNVTRKNPMKFKKQIRTLLNMAVRLGFVKKCNNHYYSSTHVQDVMCVLGGEVDSGLWNMSDLATHCSETSLSSISSSLSDIGDLSNFSELWNANDHKTYCSNTPLARMSSSFHNNIDNYSEFL